MRNASLWRACWGSRRRSWRAPSTRRMLARSSYVFLPSGLVDGVVVSVAVVLLGTTGVGTATVGCPGPRDDPGVVGGRRAAGELCRARPDGPAGAVGSARRWTHSDLRRTGRLAGHPVLEDRCDRVDADRVAQRRRDHHPGLGRDVEKLHDRFAGLRRIGIDEISYKRGHRYLTVVVDHDTGRLVWAAPGRDKATLAAFFDALGEERCAAITHVSADGADWISGVVAERCPNAVRCADPFHVVRGPPTPSTRSDGRPGTRPAVRCTSDAPAGPAVTRRC